MVLPNLIHPVPVIVQQKDDSSTFVDDDFREPVQQSARLVDVTVPGQIKWFNEDELQVNHGGVEVEADGYVLFRRVDLAALGVTLNLNDRFIKLANVETDLYIVGFRPEGHWPDQGGSTLLKAFFRDRTPSRNNKGGL